LGGPIYNTRQTVPCGTGRFAPPPPCPHPHCPLPAAGPQAQAPHPSHPTQPSKHSGTRNTAWPRRRTRPPPGPGRAGRRISTWRGFQVPATAPHNPRRCSGFIIPSQHRDFSTRHAADIMQLLQWLPGYLQKQLGIISQPLRQLPCPELEPRELNHESTRAILHAFDLTS
jgi:hypothetical protein